MANMASSQLQKKYDCVVIGAGNGGLGAAAQLAAKGAKVLLLEQHSLPGGFATSFVRGRFEFEAALHQFADVGPPDDKGAVREFLEDELDIYLDWVEVPEMFHLLLTGEGESLNLSVPFGVQPFIDTIEKAVPGSRKSVTNYVNLCKEVLEAITYIGMSKGSPDPKVLTGQYANFLKTCPLTMDQVADSLKVPAEARKILHGEWTFLGPPTNRLNFTVFAAMTWLFLTKGAYIPRLRSHEFAAAIDRRIRELGSHIQYNTKVEQVLVENGQITGVVTSQGDRIETRHVVSNASPTLVYNHLVRPTSEVPAVALRSCNARKHGVSSVVVYMGLDATLEELGLDAYSYFIYESMDTEKMYESCGRLEAPKIQATMCLNNAIPDCSPPGTSIISITTLFRPGVWDDVSPKDYVRVKNEIARDLVIDFEKATGASVREHIEEFEVATPQTFARYTGSHQGIIYGYEPEPWDSLLPRLMSLGEDQHIQGLQFTGGWAFRCHGYSSSFKAGQTSGLLTWRDMLEAGEVAQ